MHGAHRGHQGHEARERPEGQGHREARRPRDGAERRVGVPGGAGAAALRGAARSLLVVVAVIATGLAGAYGLSGARGLGGVPGPHAEEGARRDAGGPGCDLPAMDERPVEAPRRRWLVDGFNVLHVAILQGRARGAWWREEGRRQLLERAGRFAEPDAEVWVVFDGPRAPAEPPTEGPPRVVFAPSADAWLLREVGAAQTPGELTVVTADRRLADRARHRGARVVSPREFLERCG